MQPDFDELDDYDQGGFRWMSVAVLLLAISGFFLLAWYAYRSGNEPTKPGEVVVIKADPNPVKSAPENRGGMDFPHQDKSIYDAISSGSQAKPEEVVIVEDTEEPELDKAAALTKKMQETPDPAVKGSVKGGESADKKIADIIRQAVEDTQEQVEHPATKQQVDEKPEEADAPTDVSEVPVAADPVAEVEKSVEVKPAPKPQPVASAVVAAKPEPAAAMSASGGSALILQLGAFRSDTEAHKHWQKISRSMADILAGGTHEVVRADLADKGIFYRLRVKGFASDAVAKSKCEQLQARQQGCFLVR